MKPRPAAFLAAAWLLTLAATVLWKSVAVTVEGGEEGEHPVIGADNQLHGRFFLRPRGLQTRPACGRSSGTA